MYLIPTYMCLRNRNPETSVWFSFQGCDTGLIGINDPELKCMVVTFQDELAGSIDFEDFRRHEKKSI